MTDDNSLVQFFQEVLARREELDKLKRSSVGGANTNVIANSVSFDRISQSRVEPIRLNNIEIYNSLSWY